jgi:hypothetical protein
VANGNYGFFGIERKCPLCGKHFITKGEQWSYSRNTGGVKVFLCSWKCLRSWQEGHLNAVERRERIQRAIRDGLNNKEIAALLNEKTSKIQYWRDKMEGENGQEESDRAFDGYSG